VLVNSWADLLSFPKKEKENKKPRKKGIFVSLGVGKERHQGG